MKDELEIISLPHPSLRRPSQKVGLVDGEVRSLIEKMIGQAVAWEKSRPNENTVGLAAVQINRPLKVIIVREDLNSGENPTFRTLINPRITKYAGPKTVKPEGCLSVPGFYANVERHEEVRVSALDADGNPIRFKASGFMARVIQHEIDHIKGVMTVDRAVEAVNARGEKFSFCKLTESGEFQVVSEAEVAASGILNNG